MPSIDDDWRPSQRQWGEAIRDQMTVAHMSQDQLAEVVGVAQSTLQSWLTAKYMVRPLTAFRIEAVLGAKPGTYTRLMGYVPAKTAVRTTVEAIRSDPGLTSDQQEDLHVLYGSMLARTRARRLARGSRQT